MLNALYTFSKHLEKENKTMALNIQKEEKRIFHNKTVRLPEDVIAQVDKIASNKNISFNKVILYLVEYA